jgi:DNA-binding LytR/AlgR family response regulator
MGLRAPPRLQGVLTTILLTAGGIYFCSPNSNAFWSASAPFFVFVVMLLVLSASTVLLRRAYSEHLWTSHAQSAPGWRLLQEGLADLLLAAAVTVTFMKLCDFLFVHSHTVGEWSEAFLFMALIGLAGSFLAGRYNSLPAADFGSELSGGGSASAIRVEDLHYVEAEDHYVKFVLRDRVEHRRARFSDVIGRLGDTGLQVHKSFWVNKSAVAGTRRTGRRMVLVLQDGTQIPVGRANERMVAHALPFLKSGPQ